MVSPGSPATKVIHNAVAISPASASISG